MGGWQFNGDLTAATGAPRTVSEPIAYAFNTQGTQHIVYQAGDVIFGRQAPNEVKITNASINELWRDTDGWHRNDLTATTGAPAGEPMTGTRSTPRALSTSSTSTTISIFTSCGGTPTAGTTMT